MILIGGVADESACFRVSRSGVFMYRGLSGVAALGLLSCMRYFNREVVAVRLMCDGCDATVVCAPDRLPEGWVEIDPPPWHAGAGPWYACPQDAARLLERSSRQWARFSERTYLVAAKEYEELRATLRRVSHELERLKLSGERTASRKL